MDARSVSTVLTAVIADMQFQFGDLFYTFLYIRLYCVDPYTFQQATVSVLFHHYNYGYYSDL